MSKPNDAGLETVTPDGAPGHELKFDAMFCETYEDLRALAREHLRRHQRGTLLDTTALVHESYVRFAAAKRVRIEDRGHFMHYAAQVMRWVIVDFIRERKTSRRGGSLARITLATNISEELANAESVNGEAEILGVHDALQELARHNDRLVQIVEMRYFGGMTETEIATALNISDRTVRREWEKARLFLAVALGSSESASN
jgi:RNA polymerase sigma factor (TIGR02999 family)